MIRSLALLAVPLLIGATAPADPMFDIVIRGGRVLDGAGNPWVSGDVAIKDGKIVAIGTVTGTGKQEVDARGRYVAPGFIDMLDHSQRALLNDGSAVNKLRMGVTTLIAGEGGTAVPAGELTSYFDQLERQGIAVNFGTYYGAVQARVKVMGDAAGTPTEDQLKAMEAEVRTAMRAGVFGISTALIYHPASFQSESDLARLAAIPGKCGGFYATHMRDESDKLLTAIDEAVSIGERSGAKVEIFHIKAAYAPLWGKLMPQAIARIEAARSRGVDVGANIYPYRAGGTGLDVTVPTHVFAKGREAAHAALRDPAVRSKIKKELAAGSQPDWSNLVHASGGWTNVVLANAQNEKYARFHGKSFAEIGKALGKDPADAAWDIWLDALPARATALYFMMDEADIALAMKQPWVSVGTDAGATDSTVDPEKQGRPHPRANGTFPRIIAEYVKARKVLTLPDAVRKMSGWPAHRLGLSDRGLLRPGMRADVVVFDLDTIKDGATFDAPTTPPTGIDTVIVNGALALDKGQPTGARAGRVLRHPCPGI
ncbi:MULTISPECIES: amidohydrolase family protein [unclassified Sphingomonas]|uniref:N-acyl-D-amino-acid deacylase family protein n=1 Tax=unclassified Sphingomonas TaxID=196159 RepID=UPI002150E0F5|nr:MULTISPECIES: D-aminoacylase [unclassified Sphingomonas]MCR5870218.1 D-aminoacylase [Sphingomonas sp. J344]UUX98096.1 D-aminoacylase [Sphingomonas sp. J315]